MPFYLQISSEEQSRILRVVKVVAVSGTVVPPEGPAKGGGLEL